MLESFYLAHEFIRVAADIGGKHFHRLDFEIRVDDKAAAQINAGSFIIDTVNRPHPASGVGKHREWDSALEHFGKFLFLPHHVHKSAVHADGQDFNSEFLVVFIPGSNRCQFRRSHKGEIAGVEAENDPFTFIV